MTDRSSTAERRGFVAHDGRSCPVDDEAIVEVMYRSTSTRGPRAGISSPARAAWFKIGTDWWRHQSPNGSNDIVAYRLTGATDHGK